jgi:3-methyladenine DNA glycosylase AlkD
MSRFGINVDRALGVKVTDLRKLVRQVEKSHGLALELWETGIHEARLLATMIDEPAAVSEDQMESWAADFDSWDKVDQACNNLFRKTPYAHIKAVEWAWRNEEFVKRAGFALIAVLAVHDKNSPDEVFSSYLELVGKASGDERNFVKKAVSWALRQIGKRNPVLWREAMETVSLISSQDSQSARWISVDARRELTRVGRERGWDQE